MLCGTTRLGSSPRGLLAPSTGTDSTRSPRFGHWRPSNRSGASQCAEVRSTVSWISDMSSARSPSVSSGPVGAACRSGKPTLENETKVECRTGCRMPRMLWRSRTSQSSLASSRALSTRLPLRSPTVLLEPWTQRSASAIASCSFSAASSRSGTSASSEGSQSSSCMRRMWWRPMTFARSSMIRGDGSTSWLSQAWSRPGEMPICLAAALMVRPRSSSAFFTSSAHLRRASRAAIRRCCVF